FDHLLGGGLWYVELVAPRCQPQRIIEGIHTPATARTGEIRPLKLHRPDHRLDGPANGAAGWQEAITLRPVDLLSGVFAPIGVRDHRLSQATREGLAQGPHDCGHRRSGGFWLLELLLQPIEPLVKAGMELLAQSVRLFSCTDLG